MKIIVKDEPGRCRWCRCTETNACPVGCSWGNAACTVCSECIELDRMMRSANGRVMVAQAWHDRGHEHR